ncbi:MAG: hypothetical protein NTZ68_03400 [Candidatus Dependentiae bacterium]|nr:hypothetical protein [Candidatus Dependentiae bacterium]
MNNKHIALFALIVFSSASSYNMHRVARPQISATALMALRHCSAGSSSSQANETPKVETKETKYSDSRMHQDDMDEIKYCIKNNKVNYFLIFWIGWMTSLIATPQAKSDLNIIKNRQNDLSMKLNRIENKLDKTINDTSK